MSATAKVRNLTARAAQAAHLCFEMDGILMQVNAQIGAAVTAFNFPTFYAKLGNTVPGGGRPFGIAPDPSRLQYDSTGINNDPAVQGALLVALRAESAKAVLDAGVDSRQNSYYRKYANQAAIIAQMQQNYDQSVGGAASKPAMLAQLASVSSMQYTLLDSAYTADGKTGVVKSTTSALTSDTQSSGSSNTSSNGSSQGNSTGNSSSQGSASQQAGTNPVTTGQALTLTEDFQIGFWNYDYTSGTSNFVQYQPSGGGGPAQAVSYSTVYPAPTNTSSSGSTTSNGTSNQTSKGVSESRSSGTATQNQTTTNTDYGYRVPFTENQAQYYRAQISLMDQQFSQFLYGQNLGKLDQVFTNELQMIDLGVRRLQIAYLNTLLLSPISGIVTGMFKNVGEYVKAGEPVLRVENPASVYLVGTVICRASVSVGQTLQVTTQLFESSPPTTITGSIVAVRGQKSEDEWNIVATCANLDTSGNPILPLNYCFDFDDTTVTIT